ncbi:MAG: glycosyltransferase family 4 protein [Solirubrobacterales bacterium]|nr:glycosyltransferase family 4 protein [Solirubrobacterales bacterium]
MRVLLVSNLDSAQPFGQFLRPFHLGRGLAQLGDEVTSVGVDCSAVDFGPSWSTHAKSLRPLTGAVRRAARLHPPDVVYAHEARGGMAAILAGVGVPLVADFHAVPSMEWAGYARAARGGQAARYRVSAARSALAERLMARRAQRVIAAGDEVAEDIVRLHRPHAAPEVIINGVGAGLLDGAATGTSPYDDGARHAVAVVPGAQSEANVRALEFMAAVAERLTDRGAGVTLHVIGSADGPRGTGLTYHGYVDELAPWVVHADACLLPYPAEAALAGGPRNKLLEALALGRTLVTTGEGLRGLREAGGYPGVSVAPDEPEAFATAIADATRPDAVTLAAVRPDVRERLRWEKLAERVHVVLAAAAATR